MSYGPYELCDWALGSVLTALEEAERPAITTSYVGVGTVAWDDACGQLVVSPVRVYRSVEFPVEDASQENCFAGNIVLDVSVSLVRCVPSLTDAGRSPTQEALRVAHKSILDDAAVVWQAVHGDMPEDWERAAVSQDFGGSLGGAVAIQTRLLLGVEAELWCGPWPT